MSTPASDRYAESLRELVRAEIASQLPFAFVWEYQVIAATPTTIDATPVQAGAPVPPLTGIPTLTGIAGGSCTPVPGTHVGIGFLDGNPGKPRLLAVFDGTPPLVSELDVSTILTLGDQSAMPLAHAQWVVALTASLQTLAAGLAALTTPPLTPVGAVGTAFTSALAAVVPSPTLKVVAT